MHNTPKPQMEMS